jgi:hypothetical protein
MQIPEVAGQFCSVLCAEQAIYERGCHWCGERIASGRYCSEACGRKASEATIGDGQRLREWLRRHGEAVTVQIPAATGETCLPCGGGLAGKRRDSVLCFTRSKMVFWRLPGNLQNGHLSVTAE